MQIANKVNMSCTYTDSPCLYKFYILELYLRRAQSFARSRRGNNSKMQNLERQVNSVNTDSVLDS